VEAITETYAGEALSITTSGGANVSASGTQTIAITDNDSANISITGGTTTVAEGGAAQNVFAALSITSSGSGAEQLDVAVSANLPGNADYSSTAASFGVGAASGAIASVSVSAIDDRRVETTTETFAGEAFGITSSGGANVTASGSHTIAVTDNDSASVAITSGTTTVAEGGVTQNVVATLTIASTGSGTEQLDVAVSANMS